VKEFNGFCEYCLRDCGKRTTVKLRASSKDKWQTPMKIGKTCLVYLKGFYKNVEKEAKRK